MQFLPSFLKCTITNQNETIRHSFQIVPHFDWCFLGRPQVQSCQTHCIWQYGHPWQFKSWEDPNAADPLFFLVLLIFLGLSLKALREVRYCWRKEDDTFVATARHSSNSGSGFAKCNEVSHQLHPQAPASRKAPLDPTMTSFICKCCCKSDVQVPNSTLTTIHPTVVQMENKFQWQISKESTFLILARVSFHMPWALQGPCWLDRTRAMR